MRLTADGVKNSPDSDFMCPLQNVFKALAVLVFPNKRRQLPCPNKVIRVAYIKIQIQMELGCKIPIVNACNFAHQIRISSFVSAFKFAKLKISNGNGHGSTIYDNWQGVSFARAAAPPIVLFCF